MEEDKKSVDANLLDSYRSKMDEAREILERFTSGQAPKTDHYSDCGDSREAIEKYLTERQQPDFRDAIKMAIIKGGYVRYKRHTGRSLNNTITQWIEPKRGENQPRCRELRTWKKKRWGRDVIGLIEWPQEMLERFLLENPNYEAYMLKRGLGEENLA